MNDDEGAITRLLRRAADGDIDVQRELLPLVYDELRRVAARQLAGERRGHTLSPTALVHEAYLRLPGGETLSSADRRQFFALAARRMRQVLIDHARLRDAAKRGGGAERDAVTLSSLSGDDGAGDVDLIALEQALQQLQAADERKARIVELRYFGGLDMSDIAELLGISRATAQRDWEVARTFLFDALA